MVNYILARHDWPMVVVRNRNKSQYIDALHQSDVAIGPTPSDGAHASFQQIGAFARYFQKLVTTELEYDIDFVKEQSPNVWWYDGQKITFRSKSTPVILKALKDDPDIHHRVVKPKGRHSHLSCQKATSPDVGQRLYRAAW